MLLKRLFKRNDVKYSDKILLNDFEFSVIWINGELNPMLKEVSKKYGQFIQMANAKRLLNAQTITIIV